MTIESLPPDTIIQLLSIVVYVVAVIYSGFAFWDIRRSTHSLSIKYIASGVVVLSSATALMFIAAQTSWSLQSSQEHLGFVDAVVWLLYDWLNGLTHLAVILAVRTFIRWETKTPCQHGGVCPSVALAKKDKAMDAKLIGMAMDIAKIQQRIEQLDE